MPYSVATYWIIVRGAETVAPPGMNGRMLLLEVPAFNHKICKIDVLYPVPALENLICRNDIFRVVISGNGFKTSILTCVYFFERIALLVHINTLVFLNVFLIESNLSFTQIMKKYAFAGVDFSIILGYSILE